ncbi:hypothetical protein [Budvicia aquatica]|uniref:hypothetical protein n=1 Tax=Budvicia aquatica TaxID=82979 RepID=UPI0020850C0D|nr:hypothetical protein [Budvicia aquatica]GKX53631.1 hypothetical protein SOASR029_39400 [Budvicia aquatica]
MFGFGKKHQTIRVKFIESGKAEAFAQVDLPIERLPDTFEINTTLHIAEEDWEVVSAVPPQKAQFEKTGTLDITLCKPEITYVDPSEILFSLPTINDELPALENPPSMENVMVVLEDDWRQCEFIAGRYHNEINQECQSVINIYDTQRVESGFKTLHVRKIITHPLTETRITLAALENAFTIEHRYQAVAFNNNASTIINSFAVKSPSGWIFWGQTDDNGDISTLCLRQSETADISAITGQIDAFIADNNLYLIDWIQVFVCGEGAASFSQYS